jgi:hypothetical protein
MLAVPLRGTCHKSAAAQLRSVSPHDHLEIYESQDICANFGIRHCGILLAYRPLALRWR